MTTKLRVLVLENRMATLESRCDLPIAKVVDIGNV
jgi:hypothetical protein